MAVKDLYDKACEAANKGNYDYAIELYREVLRREPEYEGARVLLRGTERRRQNESGGGTASALMALLKGMVPIIKAKLSGSESLKKIEHVEDFLEENPRHVGGLLMVGHACLDAGFKGTAVNTYKDALSIQPENKRALWALARIQEEAGEMGEALRAYTVLQRLEPNNRDLAHKLRDVHAARHMQTSGMEGAESFRDWIRDEGAAIEGEHREATGSQRGKQIAEALEELKDDDMNVTKITRLVSLYEFEGDHEKAQTLLADARKRLPDSYELRQCWGEMQLQIYERDLRDIGAALKKNPEDQALRQQSVQLDRERKQLAVEEYGWLARQHPTDHAARLKLANALFDVGDLDDAIAAFQVASRDPKLETQAAKMLGRSFCAKEQYDLALEQYNRAIARNPQMDENGIELQYLLAEAMEKSGDTDGALTIFKKIYSHDINYRDVRQKVASLSP